MATRISLLSSPGAVQHLTRCSTAHGLSQKRPKGPANKMLYRLLPNKPSNNLASSWFSRGFRSILRVRCPKVQRQASPPKLLMHRRSPDRGGCSPRNRFILATTLLDILFVLFCVSGHIMHCMTLDLLRAFEPCQCFPVEFQTFCLWRSSPQVRLALHQLPGSHTSLGLAP